MFDVDHLKGAVFREGRVQPIHAFAELGVRIAWSLHSIYPVFRTEKHRVGIELLTNECIQLTHQPMKYKQQPMKITNPPTHPPTNQQMNHGYQTEAEANPHSQLSKTQASDSFMYEVEYFWSYFTQNQANLSFFWGRNILEILDYHPISCCGFSFLVQSRVEAGLSYPWQSAPGDELVTCSQRAHVFWTEDY